MHASHENDGTIAITTQIKYPAQGTLICESDTGEITIAKGVIRPPLRTVDGVQEEESFVEDVAFGKELCVGLSGEFYSIREVGKERCNLAYQTLLFGTQDPAYIIDADSRRIEGITALDLLSSDARKKVTVGVPISLLVQEMAPWDMLRRFKVPGVRSTVYGSILVPRGDAEDSLERAITEAFSDVGINVDLEWSESRFMVLPDTAVSLAEQLGDSVENLVGRWFLVHRDPALPDGTSLFPAKFAGVLNWVQPAQKGHGIVLHPQDPNWVAAGGDFDGDAAALYIPSENFLPRNRVPRFDYKRSAPLYTTHTVGEQIMEASADNTTELLGPIVLNAMRLTERGIDSADLRTIAASAAQASVQAKKHAVDTEATAAGANLVAAAAKEATEDGARPYISDAMNAIRHASGIDAKKLLWVHLAKTAAAGLWQHGSAVEQALVRRIKAIDVLFRDTKFFQSSRADILPQSLRAAAVPLVTLELADSVTQLAAEYRAHAAKMADIHEIEDDNLRVEYEALVRNDIALVKAKFHLAITTGTFPELSVSPHEAQTAVIAYGPNRIAAQMCPAEAFLGLGKRSKRIITALLGTTWESGRLSVEDLVPIPNCQHDVNVFAQDLTDCDLQVISRTKHSTRVCLSS